MNIMKYSPDQVHWILHEHLLAQDDCDLSPRLDKALIDHGCKVTVLPYEHGDNPIDARSLTCGYALYGEQQRSECTVVYGSVQFVNMLQKSLTPFCTPGSFYRKENLSYSTVASHLGQYMLNDDFVILPLAEVSRRDTFRDKDIFIRPNDVTKAFTGFKIRAGELDKEIDSLYQLEHPDPEMLVAVSSAKYIAMEYRFIIADRKVVTVSEYRWDNTDTNKLASLAHPVCEDLANIIAEDPWQADTVYTCDIALSCNRFCGEYPRLLELNAFSCSGLYACDTTQIAKAVSYAAWKEHVGLD